MRGGEVRLLRFLSAACVRESWVSYRTILNTDDLLPGDEKGLGTLMRQGLVEESAAQGGYRLSEAGLKAARRASDTGRE